MLTVPPSTTSTTASRRATIPTPATRIRGELPWQPPADLRDLRPPLYASPQRLIDGKLPPTAGPYQRRWIERNVVHGEGDALGEPVRHAPFQRYIVDRMYEFDPRSGEFLHDRVLIGIPKGNAKTELIGGHIGLAELAGPIAPVSPNIPLAAASWDQSNRLFTATRLGILGDEENGQVTPLSRHFVKGQHVLDDRVQHPHRRGVAYRIAGVGSTNDGGLATATLNDELHEWESERQMALWTVQSKAIRKRRAPRRLPPDIAAALGVDVLYGTFIVGITTHTDKGPDSLLGRLYDHGKKVASGEVDDPSFLFLWWEARPGYDLDDPVQRRAAIIEANPAIPWFLSVESVDAAFRDPATTRAEDERYNLNRQKSHPKAWLADDVVATKIRAAGRVSPAPPAGTSIVLFLDGSYSRDSTALVGWTLDDYGFVVDAWEKADSDDPHWTVPRNEVDATIFRATKRWQVIELAVDPPGWHRELEDWEREYGTLTLVRDGERVRGSGLVLRFETNATGLMEPATDSFASAMRDPDSTLRIDGDPRLLRHIRNARTRKGRFGTHVEKEHKDSPNKIDIAVAAIGARARAMWWAQHRAKIAARAAGSSGAYMVVD